MRSIAYFFLLLALVGTIRAAVTCTSPTATKSAPETFAISNCDGADIANPGGEVKRPCFIKYTASVTSYHRIKTNSWSKKSTVLFSQVDDSAIRVDAACPFSSPVLNGYNDNVGGLTTNPRRSEVTVAFFQGVTYHIAVGSGPSVSNPGSNGAGTVQIDVVATKFGRCDDFILTGQLGNNDLVPKNVDSPSYNGIHRGVYMEFTPDTTGPYIITVSEWSSLLAALAVYSGTCGSLTQLAKDAPAASLTEFYPQIELTLTAGTTYIIHVGNTFNIANFPAAADNGRVKIIKPVGRCESAFTWTEPGPQKVDAANAFAPTKDGIVKPVWGKFTTVAAGDVIFDVQDWKPAGAGPLTKIYRGASCNSLTEITSHTGGTRVSAQLNAAETVYVVIGHASGVLGNALGAGEGNLHVKRPVGRCTSTITLNLGNQTVSTEPAFAPAKDGTDRPVWGKFTNNLGTDETFIFETTSWSPTLDSEIRVYTGTPTGTACDGLTQVASNDNIATGTLLSRAEYRITNGATVYVMIGNNMGITNIAYSSGNLMIRKLVGRCRSAVAAAEGTNSVDAYLALAPTVGTGSTALYKPVWSKFTAGAGKAGTYSIDVTGWTTGTLSDSRLSIYRKTVGFDCASLPAATVSNDNKVTGNLLSRAEIDVDENEEILIVIGSSTTAPGYATGTFTITLLKGRCNRPVTAVGYANPFDSLALPLGLPAPLALSGTNSIYLPTWFKYTATKTGLHVFHVTSYANSGDNDAELAIFQGPAASKRALSDLSYCTNPVQLATNDNIEHPTSKLPRVELQLTINQQVMVVIGNANQNAASTARAETPNQHGTGNFEVLVIEDGRCDLNPYVLPRDDDSKKYNSTDVYAPHFALGGKNIWSPVWFTFTADAIARYTVVTTAFNNSGDDDSSIAIVYDEDDDCDDLEILGFNNDRNVESKLSKTSAYLGVGDKVKVVVGNTVADSGQWVGKVKLTVTAVAKFTITVEEHIDEDELEQGFNMLMDLPADTNMITSDYSTPGDSGKRIPSDGSILWQPIPVPEIPTHDLTFMFVGEYDDEEFISKLAKFLAERSGKYAGLGFRVGPLFCSESCAGYDIDGDDVPDDVDSCPGVTDKANRNSDGVGLGDVCQCLVNNVMVPAGKENQCLYLGHISREGTYKGQRKYSGDWTFSQKDKTNMEDYVPGDYTFDNKWLDCNCRTYEVQTP